MNKFDFNLNLLDDLVSTQYGDYGGYIQIDGHHGTDIFQLCSDYGVDTENEFLIGLTCGEHTTTGIGKRESITCSALTISKADFGNTFDEIKKNLAKINGKVEVKRTSFHVKYADFGKYIKRIDFGVLTKLSKYIEEIEITEDQ